MSVLGAAGGAYTKGVVGYNTSQGGQTNQPLSMEEIYAKALADPTDPRYAPYLQDAKKWEAAKTENMIRAFFEEMNAPLDLNDPTVKQIVESSYSRGERDMRGRGLQAVHSTAAGSEAYAGAMSGLAQHRKGLAFNALQLQSGHELGLANLRQRQNEFDAQADYAAKMQQYQSQQDTGRTIGAIGGGIIGGVGGFFAGGPAGSAAGIGAGSSIGAGLGGLAAGPPPSYAKSGSSRTRGSGY